jgi:hypothetical protein
MFADFCPHLKRSLARIVSLTRRFVVFADI